MTESKLQELKAKLQRIVDHETWEDIPVGGKPREEYAVGYDNGRNELARELLKIMTEELE